MQNFKQTLRTVICFLIVFSLLNAAIMEIYFNSERRDYQDKNDRAALVGTLDTLVVGASYAKRGIVPAELDKILGTSTYNLAHADMTMQARYEMLKKEIARNPVKLVFVEVSMDSLNLKPYDTTREGDLYTIARLESPIERQKYAFTAFAPINYGWLYYQLISRGFTDLKYWTQGDYISESVSHNRGYAPFNEKKHYKAKLSPQHEYHTQIREQYRYAKNVKYLNKIIELCSKNDIQLILIEVPMSEVSIARYANLQEVHDYYAQIASEQGIGFMDFNLWKEKTSYLSDLKYHDATHMGDELAPIFTEQFANIVQKYLAGEDVSDLFYPDYDTLCSDRGYAPQQ